MKNVIFIADFFSDDLLGGAESNDSVLISYLKNNNLCVAKVHSSACSIELLHKNKDSVFIVGNFIGLTEECKRYMIQNNNYIIYEHDHKYVANRDPSKYLNFKIPHEHLANIDFYKSSNKIVVLSEICRQVLEDNLNISNVISIGTSLWTDKKFSFLRNNLNNKKTKSLGIVNSKNPTKGTAEAVRYCEMKNMRYSLIEPAQPNDFLLNVSQYEKILFMPQVLETFCRLVAESKILNCQVLTKPGLIGMYSEKELFNLSGDFLLEELQSRTHKALSMFKTLCVGT